MSQFRLEAVHVPSQETLTYGPWPSDPDPTRAAVHVAFAHGFISGIHHAATKGEGKPEDLTFKVIEIPDDGANIVGVMVASAEAMVTHPDGTTD